MNLFNLGNFKLHSDKISNFKIDCDALTDESLEALAFIGAQLVGEFGDVISVPSGGDRFAEKIWKYRTGGSLLIVDDVLTTGQSIQYYKKSEYDKGLVIFARNEPPLWVKSIFKMEVSDGLE